MEEGGIAGATNTKKAIKRTSSYTENKEEHLAKRAKTAKSDEILRNIQLSNSINLSEKRRLCILTEVEREPTTYSRRIACAESPLRDEPRASDEANTSDGEVFD